VRHGEDGVLATVEQRLEPAGDPCRRLRPALTATRALDARRVRPGPRTVVVERAALERPEADLVELGEDEPLGRARPERELERLLGAREPCRDTEVDLLGGQRRAQRERLVDALFGEALARGLRADAVGKVRARVPVADEQQAPQNSTLR
jgi:hypothetical protein